MRAARSGRRRTPLRCAGLALAATLTAGCGFTSALAHPHAQAGGPAAPATTGTPAPTTPAGPRATMAVRYEEAGLDLTLTAGPVETAETLPFHQFLEDCPVDWRSLQWVPVRITSPAVAAGLAGHLTVHPTAATPADADVGVFFGPGIDSGTYCTGYPPLPATDTFWSIGGGDTVTAYVVLDQAVSAATPAGRPEVFPTLELELSDVRRRFDTDRELPLTVHAVTAGAPCADDPQAVCAQLQVPAS